MEYLEAWGTLIHEKNLKSKISCQTPFKGTGSPVKVDFWWHECIYAKLGSPASQPMGNKNWWMTKSLDLWQKF